MVSNSTWESLLGALHGDLVDIELKRCREPVALQYHDDGGLYSIIHEPAVLR